MSRYHVLLMISDHKNVTSSEHVQKLMQQRRTRTVGDYIIIDEKIGSGAFATVWKGYHKIDGHPVAAKVVYKNKLSEKAWLNLQEEINICGRFHHSNIVKMEYQQDGVNHMYLILEYCAGGDLFQYCRSLRHYRSVHSTAPVFSEEEACHLFRQIATGIVVLLQENIVHRDLKPQNILIDYTKNVDNAFTHETIMTMQLKLADFGFAKTQDIQRMMCTICGTPLYMAPELLSMQNYDYRADLWSLGVIFYELLAGHVPFSGHSPSQLLENIRRQKLSKPTPDTSEICWSLLQSMLQKQASNRITLEQFVTHPFFTQYPLSSRPDISQNVDAEAPSHHIENEIDDEEDDSTSRNESCCTSLLSSFDGASVSSQAGSSISSTERLDLINQVEKDPPPETDANCTSGHAMYYTAIVDGNTEGLSVSTSQSSELLKQSETSAKTLDLLEQYGRRAFVIGEMILKQYENPAKMDLKSTLVLVMHIMSLHTDIQKRLAHLLNQHGPHMTVDQHARAQTLQSWSSAHFGDALNMAERISHQSSAERCNTNTDLDTSNSLPKIEQLSVQPRRIPTTMQSILCPRNRPMAQGNEEKCLPHIDDLLYNEMLSLCKKAASEEVTNNIPLAHVFYCTAKLLLDDIMERTQHESLRISHQLSTEATYVETKKESARGSPITTVKKQDNCIYSTSAPEMHNMHNKDYAHFDGSLTTCSTELPNVRLLETLQRTSSTLAFYAQHIEKRITATSSQLV